jgi:hypothetical protein
LLCEECRRFARGREAAVAWVELAETKGVTNKVAARQKARITRLTRQDLPSNWKRQLLISTWV